MLGAVDQEARVQAVVVGLDAALTVLGDEADPRLAVRLAYAELADGLGRAALRRWSAESETEYLERLLGALGGSGAALRRLTDLFSRARFSTEPISGAMRDEARAALHTLRAAVVGARTPGAGESRR